MKEFDLLASIIEEQEKIKRETLISKIRKRPIVELRMVCAVIIRTSENRYTLSEIGAVLNVDHATICHYSKTHINLMKEKRFENQRYKKIYEKISELYATKSQPPIEYTLDKMHNRRQKLLTELTELDKTIAELSSTTHMA